MCPEHTAPAALTDAEKERIMALVATDTPLPLSLLEKLAPLPKNGLFLWQGKYTAQQTASFFSETLADAIEVALASPAFAGLLFSGDNLPFLTFLQALQQKKYTTAKALFGPGEGFSLIYADPPFATGSVFHVPQGQAGDQPVLAYSDRWEGGMSEYCSMLWPRILQMKTLLAKDGVLCIHCDWRTAPAIRLMLDECFGPERFVNEVVWHYTGGGRSKRYFSRKHDLLLLYAASGKWKFNIDAIRVPYLSSSGYARSGITSRAGKHYRPNPKGTPRDDVFSIPMLNPLAKERVAYATQKPLALLQPIVEAFTDPGDLVADFFCGSGTALEAATLLDRRFVGCDMGEQAIATCSKRLKKTLYSEKLEANTPHMATTAFYRK